MPGQGPLRYVSTTLRAPLSPAPTVTLAGWPARRTAWHSVMPSAMPPMTGRRSFDGSDFQTIARLGGDPAWRSRLGGRRGSLRHRRAGEVAGHRAVGRVGARRGRGCGSLGSRRGGRCLRRSLRPRRLGRAAAGGIDQILGRDRPARAERGRLGIWPTWPNRGRRKSTWWAKASLCYRSRTHRPAPEQPETAAARAAARTAARHEWTRRCGKPGPPADLSGCPLCRILRHHNGGGQAEAAQRVTGGAEVGQWPARSMA